MTSAQSLARFTIVVNRNRGSRWARHLDAVFLAPVVVGHIPVSACGTGRSFATAYVLIGGSAIVVDFAVGFDVVVVVVTYGVVT